MTDSGLPVTRRISHPEPASGFARHITSAGLATLSVLAIWYLLSIYIAPWVPRILPTGAAMLDSVQTVDFWRDFILTLARVVVSFLCATLVGCSIGVLIGLSRRAEAFLAPLLALALAVPDPVYIIFAILAVGTGELAGFLALTIAVTPFVANIVCSNVKARDQRLDEMARIYHLPRSVRLFSVLFPQLVPAFLTAMRFSFALSWKLVVVVEAIGQPDGIGQSIFNSFRLIRMRDAAAVAIIFIVAMQLLERGVLGQLEAKFLRWRRQ